LEFGLIIGFLFSADRHLSGLKGPTKHCCCLLNGLETAPFKRCSSYQTDHLDTAIFMKRRVTLPGFSADSDA
jgi:hypothetical protein